MCGWEVGAACVYVYVCMCVCGRHAPGPFSHSHPPWAGIYNPNRIYTPHPPTQILGICDGFAGFDPRHPAKPRVLTRAAVEGAHLRGGSLLGTSRCVWVCVCLGGGGLWGGSVWGSGAVLGCKSSGEGKGTTAGVSADTPRFAHDSRNRQ